MSKHTPGPWNIAKGKTYCAIRTDDRVIADMRLVGLHYNEANASLIAAAPDLLEALLLCVDALEDGHWQETKLIARAAIAKATGEQR